MGMQLPTAKVHVRPFRNGYYRSEWSSEGVVFVERYVEVMEEENGNSLGM